MQTPRGVSNVLDNENRLHLVWWEASRCYKQPVQLREKTQKNSHLSKHYDIESDPKGFVQRALLRPVHRVVLGKPDRRTAGFFIKRFDSHQLRLWLLSSRRFWGSSPCFMVSTLVLTEAHAQSWPLTLVTWSWGRGAASCCPRSHPDAWRSTWGGSAAWSGPGCSPIWSGCRWHLPVVSSSRNTKIHRKLTTTLHQSAFTGLWWTNSFLINQI